jgi:sugar lactone lactonase YvrE
MRRILEVLVLAAGMAIALGTDETRASEKTELQLPGAFFPESITAAPDGALFVSSLVSGEIVRFAPGSSDATTFVPAGVNVGTAGVMADPDRNVLWACAVDLSFQTASQLRAFDLRTGALEAAYTMPGAGLCADIALARGDVYVTDTLGGRILRLSTPDPASALGGTLDVWSDDPELGGDAFLKINGIAFDGNRTLYTTNYSTGELFAVRIADDGSAERAATISLDTPMTNPDGIRWKGGYLYVAENANGLSRINPRTGARAVLDDSLDQPSSLVLIGRDIWITEGQVLRLQTGEQPNFPFKVVGFRLGTP